MLGPCRIVDVDALTAHGILVLDSARAVLAARPEAKGANSAAA
jgi:hypothetical protein